MTDKKLVVGNLHSIETMGTVDGPGNRTIFFLKGCPLRCSYCHNPDTQSTDMLKAITPEEVLKISKKYKPYHGEEGGITFSGGEPLLQGEFLFESLKLLKENGFNTCVDTSGYGDRRYYEKIFPLIDTLLLDVKAFDKDSFRRLTGANMITYEKFLNKLEENGFKGQIWIRHVMVPGFTDDKESMEKFIKIINPIKNLVERIEILPYHIGGVNKYEEMKIPYKLEGISPMDKERAKELEIYSNKLFAESLRTKKVHEETRRKEKIKEFTDREIKIENEKARLLEKLESLPLLQDISKEEMKEVLEEVKLLKIKTDEYVFKSGDHADYMYIVLEGKVKIYNNTIDGKEQIFYIYRQGDYVGGLNLMDNTSYLYTGKVISDSEIVAVPRELFIKHIFQSPTALRQMLKKSFERIRWAEELIERLSTSNATMKTAGLLIKLINDIGIKTKDGVKLELALNREELGSYSGLTRESITRKLGEFKELGYIDLVGNKTIIIKDQSALENIVF